MSLKQDLYNLERRLAKLAKESYYQSEKVYRRAGYSFGDGTGDEGWALAHNLSGQGNGFDIAYNLIKNLRDKYRADL